MLSKVQLLWVAAAITNTGLRKRQPHCVAAQEMPPVTMQCSPLPRQGTKVGTPSTMAAAHWPSGSGLEAPELTSGALPVPYLSKKNIRSHVSNSFKIKEFFFKLLFH